MSEKTGPAGINWTADPPSPSAHDFALRVLVGGASAGLVTAAPLPFLCLTRDSLPLAAAVIAWCLLLCLALEAARSSGTFRWAVLSLLSLPASTLLEFVTLYAGQGQAGGLTFASRHAPLWLWEILVEAAQSPWESLLKATVAAAPLWWVAWTRLREDLVPGALLLFWLHLLVGALACLTIAIGALLPTLANELVAPFLYLVLCGPGVASLGLLLGSALRRRGRRALPAEEEA